ncbi:MAG: DinB family protein [Ignavibacteriaceae bacterium]|nr:DinB family protein [Ignavibacteriaceae bacterium]
MEKYFLHNDINLICVTANSFPDGVLEAFKILKKKLPAAEERNLYGISYPGKNKEIVYKAAAEEAYKGEAVETVLDAFTVLKGTYLSISIPGFEKDSHSIGKAFETLISDPLIDPNGCCVEMYLKDNDVRCMVRLDPEKVHDENIALKLDTTFKELSELISPLDYKQINTIPFEGSWTAGQLARHLIKSNLGFVTLLNEQVEQTLRDQYKNVKEIEAIFLNFKIKFNSAESIMPENTDYKKEDLLNTLETIRIKLNQSVQSLDLSELCTTLEIPGMGYLTRSEAAYFAIYHTQRHIYQLKNIIKSLINK